jgi:hypothetical protein
MLQELAARTGAAAWAIGSMLFFLVASIVVAVWLVRARPEEMEARARLALEGDDGGVMPPNPESRLPTPDR